MSPYSCLYFNSFWYNLLYNLVSNAYFQSSTSSHSVSELNSGGVFYNQPAAEHVNMLNMLQQAS